MFRFMQETTSPPPRPGSALPSWILLALLILGSSVGAYSYGSDVASARDDLGAPALRSAESLQKTLSELQMQWTENQRRGVKNPPHLHITAQRIRSALCGMGTVRFCPDYGQVPAAKHVDLDRLAYAVSIAETSHCTAGTGLSKHNCHGIIECNKGACAIKRFATTNESFLAFKKLWMKAYGDHFPTLDDAKRYSGGPGDTWLERVTIAYYGRAAVRG